MIHLSTILAWVFGLLAVVAASPISQSTTSNVNKFPVYDGSLQLVFGKMIGAHFWWLFQGPNGVGVDMCRLDDRFGIVGLWPHPGPANVDDPPFPAQVTIKVKIGNRDDCWYSNDGKGNPGRLQCGYPYDLWYDFKRDPQWDQPTEDCGGKLMNRGYYVEY